MKTKGFNVVDIDEKGARLIKAMGQDVYDDLTLEAADKIMEENPDTRYDTRTLAAEVILWMHEVYIEKQLN